MSKQNPFFNKVKLWCGAGLALVILSVTGLAPSHAQSPGRLLDQPRAAGIVGERYDGFAVVRGSAPPDIAALVEKVNAERRDLYAQRSAKEGIPMEAIGTIYAGEIMRSAPSGTWLLGENGQWARK